MAAENVINSDMARTLLKKMRNQETGTSKNNKIDEKSSIETIINKLGEIEETLDKDSKEAIEARKVLIAELMKALEDKGSTLKEQKEVLNRVDENLQDNMSILKTLNSNNLNESFKTISNPKLLGDALTKGFFASSIGKLMDMIPSMFTSITGGFSRIFGLASSSLSFLIKPVGGLYSLLSSVVDEAVTTIKDQVKQLGSFLWTSAIKPILSGIGNLANKMVSIGSSLLNQISTTWGSLIGWMFTTIVPVLSAIFGFVVFTVIPMLFSIFTFMIFTVIPFIFSLIGTVLTSIATLSISLLPVILISIVIAAIAVLILYYLFKLIDGVSGWFKNFYNEYLKGWNIEQLQKDWGLFKIYWEDTLKPNLKWVWTELKNAWEVHVLPAMKTVATWVEKNWPAFKEKIKDWAGNIIAAIDLITPAIEWLGDKFRKAWDYWQPKFEKWFGDGKLTNGVDALVNYEDTIDVLANNMEAITLSKIWAEISPFAKGGIVTKPTNALIGEAGVNEAVIPLDKKGMDFIRSSFQIDPITMRQVVKSSDLYKNQVKMQTTLDIICKNVDQIKFSVSEKNNKNSITNPQEVMVAYVKSDKIIQIQGDSAQLFDIKEIEKVVSDSDKTVITKIDELIKLVKESGSKKMSIMSSDTPVVDPFNDLLKAISTGIVGVR